MSEKPSKPKKEITNPETLARLAAMRACEAAEKELYAKFPPKTKPPITEAVVSAPAPTVPESTPVAIPEGIDFDEKKVPEASGAVEKPIRRRGKKRERRQPEPVTEAEKPPVVALDETPVAPRTPKSEKTPEGEAANEGTKLTETIGRAETLNDFYFPIRNFSGDIPQDDRKHNIFSGARLADFLKKIEQRLLTLTDEEFAGTKLWNDIPSQYGIREKFSELVSAERDSYSKTEMRRDDPPQPMADDADINTTGMRGSLGSRKRKGADPIVKAQAEMDALAGEASVDESDMPAVFSSRRRAEAPLAAVVEQPAEIASGDSKEATPDAAREALCARVDTARHEYVQEDYENTNRWLKMKNFFRGIKQEKNADTEYYQAQYNNALIDLRNAELEKIKQSGLEGKELHEALAGTLKYFKYDELVSVGQERTQVRAEHQGWSGKVMGMMEWVGREYNSLSFKEKSLTAGVLWGLAGVTGGVSLVARRFFSGAGAAVALEAVTEKIADKRQDAKAEKEAYQQVEMLEKNNFWNEKRSHEADVRSLKEMIEQDIFSLDEKLQKKKHDALLRKTLSFGVGFGGGVFAKELFDLVGGRELTGAAVGFAMKDMGGNEAVDWLKGQFGEIVPTSIGEIAPGSVGTPDVLLPPYDTVTMAGAAADISAQAGAESHAGLINGFVNQNIPVEQGDSVWKISGKLADQLHLEGAQRTHFIDTLKNQFGDVRLQADTTINFSEHGIDQNFVEQALEKSNALSPEQMASISAYDAKIADFAPVNPDTSLINAGAEDAALPKTSAITPIDLGTQAQPGIQAAAETSVPLSDVPTPAEMTPAAIVSPESIQYGGRVDDWYMQIFRMEDAAPGQDWIFNKEAIAQVKLQDILQDVKLLRQGALSGYTTGLDREQITHFVEFFQEVSKNDIGFDRLAFFKEHPSATVMEYLNKVAPLVKEGQRIGLYTTTH